MMDVLQHINEPVTIAEATETVEITETAANEVEHERLQGQERSGSKAIIFFMNRKVKQAKKLLGIKGTEQNLA